MVSLIEGFERGQRDAVRGKGPIFRNHRGQMVPAIDDEMGSLDEWSQAAMAEYCRGFNE